MFANFTVSTEDIQAQVEGRLPHPPSRQHYDEPAPHVILTTSNGRRVRMLRCDLIVEQSQET